MGRVVVLGSLSQDLHLATPRLPVAGETVLSGPIERRFGGKGGNQAVAAARAGARTLFVGRVGDDEVGRCYLTRLEAFGVDVSRCTVDRDAPTGTAIVYLSDSGENMIVVSPGANARVAYEDLSAVADLGPDDVLLVQLELDLQVVGAATRLAAERGARVIINVSPYADLPAAVLALADPVVANEPEAAWLSASGVPIASLLVTRAGSGSQWHDHVVPAERVPAVDPTGAGDAYCGTLAAFLLLGAGRLAAMRAASLAGARCVQHHGAQPHAAER